jgi:oxygen-independent coproporphyrinogen III oxidase
MSLGIYISVPFCRSKCSYCNFASGVFASGHITRYVERLSEDIASCGHVTSDYDVLIPTLVDSIYLGGGTPSLLPPIELKRLFAAIRRQFDLASDSEITVECAPGTLAEPMLNSFVECGVNRVSLGVQSFVDREAAAVGRLHTRDRVLQDVERLRVHGIENINVDLLAGLPHQTHESWRFSLDQAVATGVPHVSVYMLEVDEDSRLGRELIAGGTRYHAHFVPDESLTADFYETACEELSRNGVHQYEISNFARPGAESRHNLKYWTRQPYLGFGVDAHSPLPGSEKSCEKGIDAVRVATTSSLDDFLISQLSEAVKVSLQEALEEGFFLGLRLNRGVNLGDLERRFGPKIKKYAATLHDLEVLGLLDEKDGTIRLTRKGRLLSNEVFEKFIDLRDGLKDEPARAEISS